MTDKLTLTQKLARIQGELAPIVKSSQGSAPFKARSIDDVIDHLNPLLSKYGVVVKTRILETERGSHVTQTRSGDRLAFTAYTKREFCFTDGSEECLCTEEEGFSIDFGDKAVTQAASMCQKYAYIRVFNIKSKDMVDPDGQDPRVTGPKTESDRMMLIKGTKHWNNVVEKLGNGEVTLDQVQEAYEIDNKLISYLKKIKPNNGQTKTKQHASDTGKKTIN